MRLSPKFFFRLKTFFIIFVITALLAELAIRALVYAGKLSLTDYRRERVWEDVFMRSYESGDFGSYNIMQSDPVLGWSLKPDFTGMWEGHRYTTNAQGFRSLENFGYKPDKYNIVVLGDSFTFGDDIDDQHVWPTLLKNHHKDFNVINLGVTAYGIDQMYLMLQRHIETYKPDLVILAFIGDDLGRSQLKFRDFKKPQFALENGVLKLTNTPIGSPDEVYAELKKRHSSMDIYSHSALLSFVRYAIHVWEFYFDDVDRMSQHHYGVLNKTLFTEMEKTTRQSHGQLLLVWLPTAYEVWNLIQDAEGYLVARAWADQSPDRNLLNMSDVFHPERNFPHEKGHYHKEENTVLAATVADTIYRMDSWQQFQARKK